MKKFRKFHVTVTHDGELVSYNKKSFDTLVGLLMHVITIVNDLINGAEISIKVEMEVQS